MLTKTLSSQKIFIHSLLDYWIIFVSYDISWSWSWLTKTKRDVGLNSIDWRIIQSFWIKLNQSLWGAGALMYHRPGTWGQCVFMYLWYVFVSQTKILRPMWADVCLSCQRVAGLRAPCEESASAKVPETRSCPIKGNKRGWAQKHKCKKSKAKHKQKQSTRVVHKARNHRRGSSVCVCGTLCHAASGLRQIFNFQSAVAPRLIKPRLMTIL